MVADLVLKTTESTAVAVHVLWTPVLPGDSLVAARNARSTLDDPRVTHYWDEDQSLGLRYGSAVRLPNNRKLAWDIYFVFKPGVKWEQKLPEPSDWWHQLGSDRRYLGDGQELRRFVEKVRPKKKMRVF